MAPSPPVGGCAPCAAPQGYSGAAPACMSPGTSVSSGLAVVGVHRGVQVAVPANGIAVHSLSLLAVRPGLYQLGLTDVCEAGTDGELRRVYTSVDRLLVLCV